MNIQIYGKNKCFDTKKAERWFKERRIKFQSIDLRRYGMSPRELESVKNAVGLDALIDPKHPDAALLRYLAHDADRMDKLLEDPSFIRTPVVRNGKQATVGYCPEIWATWE
jgi:arsenate reductase